MTATPAQKTIRVYCAAAAFCAVLVLWLVPFKQGLGAEWFLLPGLALLAEFIPVQLSRRGIRITFTLPYIAGMAVAAGSSAALLLEFLVTVSVAFALSSSGRRKVAGHWIAANAAIAVLCVGAGSLCMALAGQQPALMALAFTCGYVVANLALVASLDFALFG